MLHLLVKGVGRESTCDLRIFQVAYRPENTFWRAGCSASTI